MARHRWWVLAVWAVVFVAAAAAYPHLAANLSAPDYSVNGSDSAEVTDLIGSDFSAAGAEQDVIVFDADTLKVTAHEYQSVVDDVVKAVKGQPGVVALVGPTDPGAQGQISADEHAAFAGFLPLVTALAGLTFTFGTLSLLIRLRPIDYSLFVLSRFREELVKANWWLPGFLRRILPRVKVE